jgi:hypothetical protein
LPAPADHQSTVPAQAVDRGATCCSSQELDRGALLGRGAQANSRGAAQVLDCCAHAVARGTARRAPQELDRDAQAVPSSAARCASQVLDRGARGAARCASQVFDRGAQAVTRGAAQVLGRLRVLTVCCIARGTTKLSESGKYLFFYDAQAM